MSAECVRVVIGNEHYALPIENVLEVAVLGDVTAIPGAQSSLLGVINRDGQLLPVVDLASVIGAPSSGRADRLLIVDDGRRRAGLLVDAVVDVCSTPVLSESTESEMFTGAAFSEGSLVGMLALGSVLDAAADRRGAPDGS
jgi:chemotaxis signal transduction protein